MENHDSSAPSDSVAPIDKSRYWLSKCGDSLDPLDAEEISIVAAIESEKAWEKLGIPLLCSLCAKIVGSHCNHCNECPDFQVCPECTYTERCKQALATEHAGHGLVLLQYRPIAVPLYNGSDLQLIEKFSQVKSEKDFFTYFPFFFNDLSGMDDFTASNRQKIKQLWMEKPELVGLKVTTNFPTDWFVRTYGHGDWQSLHQSLMDVHIHQRLLATRMTSRLYKLLVQLRYFQLAKKRQYGKNNIPATEWAVSTGRKMLRNELFWGKIEPFIVYTLPCQFHTQLDAKISIPRLERVLPNVHALKGWDPVSGFLAFFKDDPEIVSVQEHMWIDNDDRVRFFVLKPAWVELIEGHTKVRRANLGVDYGNIPRIPHARLEMFKFRCIDMIHQRGVLRTGSMKGLVEATRLRECGRFKEAVAALEDLDLSHPLIAFELQRVYEEQGFHNKECKWFAKIWSHFKDGIDQWADGQSLLPTFSGRALLHLILAYHRCYTCGEWNFAQKIAEEIWLTHLKKWEFHTKMWGNISILVHMEVYYHRINLACFRDQNMFYDGEAAIRRLGDIRQALQSVSCVPESWIILQLQLELAKVAGTAQYLDHEASFSVTIYWHSPDKAIPFVLDFLNQSAFQDQVSRSFEYAHASLLLAQLYYQRGGPELAKAAELLDEAEDIYKLERSEGGLMDITIEWLKQDSPAQIPYGRISTLAASLRAKDDLRRLRTIRKLSVRPLGEHEAEDVNKWQEQQRVDQRILALEAGDMVQAQRWKLRRYCGNMTVTSLFEESQSMLDHHAVPQSTLLMTLASFNLASIYLYQGNHFEAALHAVLHYCLVRDANSTEWYQRAILMILKVIEAAFASHHLNSQGILMGKLCREWHGWLGEDGPSRWLSGSPVCDEIDRFIEAACFLPRLAGKMAQDRIDKTQVDEMVADTVFRHLRIAFGLFDSLPRYMTAAIAPKLALALGAAANYAGNRELGCRAYHEGLQMCHTGDVVSIANLRLEAGKSMTSLTSEDPEYWAHVLRPGRRLLQDAIDILWDHIFLEGALLRCCDAYSALLRSFVAEARGLKWLFERGVPKTSVRVALTLDEDLSIREDALSRISKLVNSATKSFQGVSYIYQMIRREIQLKSRFEKSRSLRYLVSNSVASEAFDSAYEIALIVALQPWQDKEDPKLFHIFWNMMQARKATILQEQTQDFQSAEIIEAIRSSPKALRMYRKEQTLIKEGKNNFTDLRLTRHRIEMESVPELKRLMDSRRAEGATFKSLRPLARVGQNTLDEGQNIVLVDGHNIATFTVYAVEDVEKWVENRLKDQDGPTTRNKLDDENVFRMLHELVKPIHKHVNPGSLLVFSPAQILHSVPLHAIPFKDVDDFPVIYYHPVIYCPSAAVLTNVVLRSTESTSEPFKGAFFGRYGDLRPDTEATIHAGLEKFHHRFQSAGGGSKLVTGKELTRNSFDESLEGCHLIHFHGHAGAQQLTQYLELDESDLHVSKFRLQDAFAISLPPALVMLIACASGAQDVALNDDAMGLLTAFFAAGATTVVGTLWPIDSEDGLQSSRIFYEESFLWGSHPSTEMPEKRWVNLAKAMQKAVLGMRASDSELCMDDDEERQLNPREIWRWAGYVLQGSWAHQSI